MLRMIFFVGFISLSNLLAGDNYAPDGFGGYYNIETGEQKLYLPDDSTQLGGYYEKSLDSQDSYIDKFNNDNEYIPDGNGRFYKYSE